MIFIIIEYVVFTLILLSIGLLTKHNRKFTDAHFMIFIVLSALATIGVPLVGTDFVETNLLYGILGASLTITAIPILIRVGIKLDKYSHYKYFNEQEDNEIVYSLSFEEFKCKFLNDKINRWWISKYAIEYSNLNDVWHNYKIGLKTKEDYIQYCDWYEKYKKERDIVNKNIRRKELLAVWEEGEK